MWCQNNTRLILYLGGGGFSKNLVKSLLTTNFHVCFTSRSGGQWGLIITFYFLLFLMSTGILGGTSSPPFRPWQTVSVLQPVLRRVPTFCMVRSTFCMVWPTFCIVRLSFCKVWPALWAKSNTNFFWVFWGFYREQKNFFPKEFFGFFSVSWWSKRCGHNLPPAHKLLSKGPYYKG